jgi:hypothetical protein
LAALVGSIGVIFQGPLVHHGKSVLNPAVNLKQKRDDLEIIISTNDQSYSENIDVLRQLEKWNIEVIKHVNMAPVEDKARNHHVRNMLLGTQIALEHLTSDYVFRFRSDHDVMEISQFELPGRLKRNISQEFPICVSTFGTHHRILGQLRRGCISDHSHFGRREDLLNYWFLDDLIEELIAQKNHKLGSVPTNLKFYVEQMLYLAWRVRSGLSDELKIPKISIWEEEFAYFFRLLTPEVVNVNLHSNLEIWKEQCIYDGSFLRLSPTRATQFNYKLLPFQIRDDLNRWKDYLRQPKR